MWKREKEKRLNDEMGEIISRMNERDRHKTGIFFVRRFVLPLIGGPLGTVASGYVLSKASIVYEEEDFEERLEKFSKPIFDDLFAGEFNFPDIRATNIFSAVIYSLSRDGRKSIIWPFLTMRSYHEECEEKEMLALENGPHEVMKFGVERRWKGGR